MVKEGDKNPEVLDEELQVCSLLMGRKQEELEWVHLAGQQSPGLRVCVEQESRQLR